MQSPRADRLKMPRPPAATGHAARTLVSALLSRVTRWQFYSYFSHRKPARAEHQGIQGPRLQNQHSLKDYANLPDGQARNANAWHRPSSPALNYLQSGMELPDDFVILKQKNRTCQQTGRCGLRSSHKNPELDVAFQYRVSIEDHPLPTDNDSISHFGGLGLLLLLLMELDSFRRLEKIAIIRSWSGED